MSHSDVNLKSQLCAGDETYKQQVVRQEGKRHLMSITGVPVASENLCKSPNSLKTCLWWDHHFATASPFLLLTFHQAPRRKNTCFKIRWNLRSNQEGASLSSRQKLLPAPFQIWFSKEFLIWDGALCSEHWSSLGSKSAAYHNRHIVCVSYRVCVGAPIDRQIVQDYTLQVSSTWHRSNTFLDLSKRLFYYIVFTWKFFFVWHNLYFYIFHITRNEWNIVLAIGKGCVVPCNIDFKLPNFIAILGRNVKMLLVGFFGIKQVGMMDFKVVWCAQGQRKWDLLVSCQRCRVLLSSAMLFSKSSKHPAVSKIAHRKKFV